ncbi:hypothetical protein [Facklamia sp. 7083-14-GEN3]|uniref:hypothetical protein n=1 Tax=Facklamia sp. 7083-14-GEN3 TaxID=2973478 RepID=UPI00215CD735|nr:hypothetical protein [Facklamia sp. 7083-14-GEN3]MCR8968755.1 hypothetical protein [Facklamia sp. 7083-14-GEN3]
MENNNRKKLWKKIIIFAFAFRIFSGMINGLSIFLFDKTPAEYFAELITSLINK